jgi:cytochrome P450
VEHPEAQRPSVHDVAQDGFLAVVAGSDTTSSVLTAAFYYLLIHPEAYKRLQEEIDSTFSGEEEPLAALRLSYMEWLNGCM